MKRIELDEDYFVKHQKLLVMASNSIFTRWLLGLNRLPQKGWKVDRITPNAVHQKVGGKKWKGMFFTRPRFAEALAYNLSPFFALADSLKIEEMPAFRESYETIT